MGKDWLNSTPSPLEIETHIKCMHQLECYIQVLHRADLTSSMSLNHPESVQDWTSSSISEESSHLPFLPTLLALVLHTQGSGYPLHLSPGEASKQPGSQAQGVQEMNSQRHLNSHNWEVYKVKIWFPFSEVITSLQSPSVKPEVTQWSGTLTLSSPHSTAHLVYHIKWSL